MDEILIVERGEATEEGLWTIQGPIYTIDPDQFRSGKNFLWWFL